MLLVSRSLAYGVLAALVTTLATVGAGELAAACAAPPPPIVVVDPHVVTDDRCAVLELRLDSGVTKDLCLTADQLEQVMEQR